MKIRKQLTHFFSKGLLFWKTRTLDSNASDLNLVHMIWKNGLLFKDKIGALIFAHYLPEDSLKDQSNTWCEHTLKTVQVHFNSPNK